jgi:signal transduction histidine kinase
VKTQVTGVSTLHVRANRSDLISRLADDLAHEIKNPIHAAVINLELLRRRIGSGESDRALERVGLLEEEVARVHALVEALLLLLRPLPEAPEWVEAARLLEELRPLLEALGKVSRVAVDLGWEGGSALVHLRRAAFRHAMLNVAVNAFDAMRPNGGRLSIHGDAADNEVRFRIRDTGPGIPAEYAARLGEPGFSTRPGRAGIGLAVARELLGADGGRLLLDHPGGDGRGATFTLAIPRATPLDPSPSDGVT